MKQKPINSNLLKYSAICKKIFWVMLCWVRFFRLGYAMTFWVKIRYF